MTESSDRDAYYTKLFTENPLSSTPFPNVDESRRWGKICEFLSEITEGSTAANRANLRILDIGCGRGWLTHLASAYGYCEGIDPVESSIRAARRHFPSSTFYVGTAADVRRATTFRPFDVVITSEVIEHVLDKEQFVSEIRNCLVPGGHVIVTTPRGEEQHRYRRLGFEEQPIEAWISEKDLRSLFARHQFTVRKHDRAYLDLSLMSVRHRIAASPKVSRGMDAVGLTWILKGLQYAAAIYQVWLFRASEARDES